MEIADLVLIALATAVVVGMIGLGYLVIRIVGPHREQWGVDAEQGIATDLAFTPTKRGTMRIWARIETTTDEDSANGEVEMEAWAGASCVLPRTAWSHFGARYWSRSLNGAGEFTIKLWKTPVLSPGVPVRFRATIRRDASTVIRAIRIFATT